MIQLFIENSKKFMNKLFKEEIFDNYYVRGITIYCLTKYEISGALDKDYLDAQNTDSINRSYCLWSEIKPIVFSIIKGNKQPKLLKVILSIDNEKAKEIHENSATLFININYESGELNIITGASQKNFSLDKSLDKAWDKYVTAFLDSIDVSSKNVLDAD